jgi:predicted ATPase
VLRYLVERPGQLVTKDELLAAVWAGTVVSEAALTKGVHELRQALNDDAHAPRYIATVHRRGLRFLALVTSSTQPVRRRAVRGQRRPASPPHHRPPTPALVGRDAELAQLWGWSEQALRGARQMVFVTGEAGIGKTTVVDALVQRLAREQRVWVARGQCIEYYGQGEPYMPVLEALEQLGRGPARLRLVPLLRQYAPTWLVQLPGLLRGSERARLERQVQGAGQARMLRELATALDVLSARQGLVLWLEDLQWSDVSTLDVLAMLGRRQAPARLLVLGTYRPVDVLVRDHPLKGVKQELQGHGQCQELALDFLSAAAVQAYLVRRFPGLGQDAGGLRRLAQFVHQRTDGNALFMVNMVEYVVQQGVLREVEGQWALHGQMGDVAGGVPESLQQMIEHHFAYLQPAEQRLLEVASVEGVEFSTAAVAAGLETAADTVEEGCEGLVRRQHFVRASRTEAWPDGTVVGHYRFIHGLYQEVVYRRVPAGRRARLHQAIGARKEAGYGDRAPEIAAELALHFARGRDYGQAVRYYRQTGARALAGSAYREAVRYLEQALAALAYLPPDRATLEQAVDLRGDLSAALEPLAQWEQALPHLREAETIAERLGDHRRLGRIYRRLASVLRNLRDGEALAYCQRAHAVATALGDIGLQIWANLNMGVSYHDLGDYHRAIACVQQMLTALQEVLPDQSFGGVVLPGIRARIWMVNCLGELGEFADGVA